jgi:hypothetical protein
VRQGLKGNVPYPTERNGADLRKNRSQLLQAADLVNLSNSENRNR